MGKKRTRLTRSARKDLDDIWLEIARDNVDAATRFVDQLASKFPSLAAFPKTGRARDEIKPGLRSFPVKNYLILYRPTGKNHVEIVRVVHGARNLKALFK